MQYEVFRSAVLELLREDTEWNVHAEWEETPSAGAVPDLNEDFIELEQEKGPFYEFMTVSLNRLYQFYLEDGWDAVQREVEKYTRREQHGRRRTRGIDYEARLNEEGTAMYRELRDLRSRIAAKRQLPPYFIFMNRSLYEMCCRQPSTEEELRGIYGVGEKNSREYGDLFLEKIQEITGGERREMMKMPGA